MIRRKRPRRHRHTFELVRQTWTGWTLYRCACGEVSIA